MLMITLINLIMQFLITLVFACTTVGSTYDLGSLPQDTFGYSPKAYIYYIAYIKSFSQLNLFGEKSQFMSLYDKKLMKSHFLTFG